MGTFIYDKKNLYEKYQLLVTKTDDENVYL